jgi:hypothetical protein
MIGEKDAELPMHLDVQARNKKDAEAAEKLCKGAYSSNVVSFSTAVFIEPLHAY